MEEELQTEQSVNIQTEVLTSAENEKESALNSLPRLEELRKSEQQVKVQTEVQGATEVEHRTQTKDRFFTKKKDEKKVLLKKRVKILSTVYLTVVALLLGFTITNVVTLAMLNKTKTTNTDTIASQQQVVDTLKEQNPTIGEEFTISLNEPRDYSEDKKELTFLDKLTILFRNIFG